jgi:hypothetical protein
MFIGHYAPALVAAAHPRSPGLGLLFVAGQLVDFGFFGLALLGVENFRITPGITTMVPLDLYDMPYTHSLLGSALWALGFAALIWMITRSRTGAVLAGAVVLSHWFLDLLVHAPDLTLAGSPPKLGLGLWNYPLVEMPLELLLSFGALGYYLWRTHGSRGWQSAVAPVLLAALLLLVQAINWFGPEPEAANSAMMITALVAFSLLALAASWLGATRRARKAAN